MTISYQQMLIYYQPSATSAEQLSKRLLLFGIIANEMLHAVEGNILFVKLFSSKPMVQIYQQQEMDYRHEKVQIGKKILIYPDIDIKEGVKLWHMYSICLLLMWEGKLSLIPRLGPRSLLASHQALPSLYHRAHCMKQANCISLFY